MKIPIALALGTLITLSATEVLAATRITFARGSYCGSYAGNFRRGKEFVLGLQRGQTFSTRNIGGGTQYNVYVRGPRGEVSGEPVSESQINYFIPRSGDHYIRVVSSTPYSNIEFCAR